MSAAYGSIGCARQRVNFMQGDFTLSYHFYRQRDSRNHLELFLDRDGKSLLQTWQSFGKSQNKRRFVAAPDHRRLYLDFSGVLSEGRGRLKILRKGKFIDRRRGASDSLRIKL
jgi:hypothetical protein